MKPIILFLRLFFWFSVRYMWQHRVRALIVVLGGAVWRGTEQVVPGTPVASLGERMLTTYLVPFEVAGVLLMIVMVGAAHLARQERKS